MWKTNNSIDDSKQGKRRTALSCSKKLSTLLRGKTSKYHGDFFCLNCLHSFRTENKLKPYEKVYKNKDFCGIVMLSEKDKILEFNQYLKSDKMQYIIYADIESLIKKNKKIERCANNPENSSTTKIEEHISCRYSMSTIWAFDHIENKHTSYHGKDCMKKFCPSLREHTKYIIDFEKKKMLPLTEEELKSHQGAKICYICGKTFLKKFAKNKNCWKVRDHCHFTGKYRDAAHSIYNLKLNLPNKIPVVFHNDSNYDYHFIIKELANEFEKQFKCLGENTEKYKTFSVSIKKEVTKVDHEIADGNESFVTISYKIKFIDSARFLASSLSNLVDSLADRIHKIKCKDCDCFLEYESVKDNLREYECLYCNKDFQTSLMKN